MPAKKPEKGKPVRDVPDPKDPRPIRERTRRSPPPKRAGSAPPKRRAKPQPKR